MLKKFFIGNMMLISLLVLSVQTKAAELTNKELLALTPQMVKVQFHLQYHNGQEPDSPNWREQCPGCGRYHINKAASAVNEERPAELPGILLSPTKVLAPDPVLHPRFIEKISIVKGDEIRRSEITSYALHQSGIILELDEPFPEARELNFNESAKPPYFAVTYRENNGRWLIKANLLNTTPAITDYGKSIIAAPAPSLIVDADGQPITANVQTAMPAKNWQRPPANWKWISSEELNERLDKVSELVDSSVVRVHLKFRAPRSNPQYSHYSTDEENLTEMDKTGVILQNGQLLVLAEITPRTTARLEKIRAFLPEGKMIEADFKASLEDYGIIVAELLEMPEGIGVKLSQMHSEDIQDLRNHLLPAVMIKVIGKNRLCRHNHIRINRLDRRWRQQLIPRMNDLHDKVFAFDSQNQLLLMPISRRDPTLGSASNYFSSRSQPIATAITYIKPVLANLDKHSDTANVPRNKEEAERLGWLGLDLQELTEEMAKMAGAIDEIDQYHRKGALISYVYPDSPADEAGLESGMILMQIRLPKHPRPISVQAESDHRGGEFPWEQLDNVPDEYLAEIPPPWPKAESEFNKTLTNIGIGKTIIADIIHDGERMEKEFVIKEGPPHYDIAQTYKAEELGMSVRNLTYELRRYFRRPEGEPGVVISEIKPGGRAATAGLKPYEIITHINETAVHNVEEYKKAMKGKKEVKLSVRRMARGRLTRLTLPDKEK